MSSISFDVVAVKCVAPICLEGSALGGLLGAGAANLLEIGALPLFVALELRGKCQYGWAPTLFTLSHDM
eukprot:3908566-Pyramimonas_sp.AAC.1